MSNVALRREFERRRDLGWVTPTDVAYRCGWVNKHGAPDVSRVVRVLGITKCKTKGYSYFQRAIREEIALQLVDALGADPVDVGL